MHRPSICYLCLATELHVECVREARALHWVCKWSTVMATLWKLFYKFHIKKTWNWVRGANFHAGCIREAYPETHGSEEMTIADHNGT